MIRFLLTQLLKQSTCKVFGHDAVYWDTNKLLQENALGGIFRPFKCNRCGYESPVFKYPRYPRLPIGE